MQRELQSALFPLMSMQAVPFHANPKPKLPLNLSGDSSLGVRNLDTQLLSPRDNLDSLS